MAKSTKASKKKVESLVKVTEINRKFCIKIGRRCYAYKTTGKAFDEIGQIDIRPRIHKGWMKIDGKNVNISEDEDPIEYATGMKAVIDLLIREGKLYINPEEPLIKYEQKT